MQKKYWKRVRTMLKFKYCPTHFDDEIYMNRMSGEGYQVKRLVEGFWKFEKDSTKYVYHIYYFRGMKKKEIERLKKELKKQKIEFVSRYLYWGIFRSKTPFTLYSDEENVGLCKRIRLPMLYAMAICPILLLIFEILTFYVSKYFLLIELPLLVYFGICTYLTFSYTRLIDELEKDFIWKE